MKMTRSLLAAALVFCAIALTGCFDETTGAFNQEPQVGFAQFNGAFAVTVPDNIGTITEETASDQLNQAPLQLQLIGPQQSAPVPITVEVVADETSLPADAYSLPADIAIPADSSSAQIPLGINDGVLDDGTSGTLTLRITDAGLRVATNFNTYEVEVIGAP
jgi:hypothetical protein